MSYETTKDMFATLINPYQLLIISPYSIYLGLNLGFVLSEATRAYASCILGVNLVSFVHCSEVVCCKVHIYYSVAGQCYTLAMVGHKPTEKLCSFD